MSAFIASSQLCDNHLLALLPTPDLQALMPCLELVELNPKEIIGEEGKLPTHIYFPLTAVLSVLNQMLDGHTVEVCTVGNEGFYGIDVLIGSRSAAETTLCQVKGRALRMSTPDFIRAIEGNTPLRQVAQRYLQAYLSMMSQSVACNRLHGIEARFARWVLMTHDRVRADDFFLTQEFLADMLGVHRPSVSVVAGSFQEAGMIRYNRGHMTVLKRDALEDACCECYEIVNKKFEHTIGFSPSHGAGLSVDISQKRLQSR